MKAYSELNERTSLRKHILKQAYRPRMENVIVLKDQWRKLSKPCLKIQPKNTRHPEKFASHVKTLCD
jgi:hypothetical protein